MTTDLHDSTRMRAHAVVTTRQVQGPRGPRTAISRLRSQTPLVLRPTIGGGRVPSPGRDQSAAHVALATGAGGPVGGDEYTLDITVGEHSTLVLTEVSATLVLPGPRGLRSRMHCRVRVEDGGTLIWVPHPLIAAARCRHEHRIDVELAADARFYYREEILLGRHGEGAGDLDVYLSIRRAGAPLLRQHLSLGPAAPGSGGGAALGDAGAVGSFVIVDPGFDVESGSRDLDPRTGLFPLAEGALLCSALADDGQAVRRALDQAGASLGQPWGSDGRDASKWSAVPR